MVKIDMPNVIDDLSSLNCQIMNRQMSNIPCYFKDKAYDKFFKNYMINDFISIYFSNQKM